MSETPSHQAPKLSHCDALTPSHHISPHATAFQAALPLDLCRRGVVCFVSGFGLRFGECCDMASRGIPWRAVSQVQSLIWEAKERPEKTVTTDAADVQKTNSHYQSLHISYITSMRLTSHDSKLALNVFQRFCTSKVHIFTSFPTSVYRWWWTSEWMPSAQRSPYSSATRADFW